MESGTHEKTFKIRNYRIEEHLSIFIEISFNSVYLNLKWVLQKPIYLNLSISAKIFDAILHKDTDDKNNLR